MTAVAKTKDGLTRAQIGVLAKLSSGGKLTQYLDNLEQSGFVEVHEPLGARGERYWRYRSCDMFTLFHLQWLAGRLRKRSWHAIVSSQQYRSWCGHAFEIVAWNHAHSIASTLGIAGRRSIIVCLLAPEGLRANEHSKAAVDLVLDAEALFRDGQS